MSVEESERVGDLTRSVAAVVVLLLPITALGWRNISLGAVLALLLGPVIIPKVGEYAKGWALLALGGLTLLAGPVMASVTVTGGRALDVGLALRTIALVGTMLLTLACLLWSRQILGTRLTALLYASGLLVQALLNPVAWAANPWKLAFAWPVTVVALVLVRSAGKQVVLLAGLAVFSVAQDFRSFAGLAVAAAGLALWRRRPTFTGKRTLRPLAMVGLVLFALLQVGTYLAVEGHLGRGIQARTQAQTNYGEQWALTGARPELMAGVELARHNPPGLGTGIVPSLADAAVVRRALSEAGMSPDSQYVNFYVLGGRFELHSIIGDLWLNFGIPGLALAISMGWIVLKDMAQRLAVGGVSSLRLFVALLALWDLMFSPLSNLPHLILAVAMAFSRGRKQRPQLTALPLPSRRGGSGSRSG